jgi:hypothetical protein
MIGYPDQRAIDVLLSLSCHKLLAGSKIYKIMDSCQGDPNACEVILKASEAPELE